MPSSAATNTIIATLAARCCVEPYSTAVPVFEIRNNAHPNFLIDSQYAVCRVETMDGNALAPGSSGDVKVEVILLESDRGKLTEGATFEFRNGPLLRWAKCRITAIIGIAPIDLEPPK